MYAEKILGIVNVHRKNTRHRQCKEQECSGTTMYVEKMLGIVNAKWENARNYVSFKLFGPHPPPIHTPSITFFLAVRPFFITFNFGVRGKRITFFQKIPPGNILCEKRKFSPAAHYCGQIKAQRHYKSAPQAKKLRI